ncbi:Ig-like V-type domain-containing protein FAM187A [Antennarius striatus]|uniref:Ig-like V-type domain-containing protein FAM187A n=1 Tax=Antennarius striatus TaxID=241820 RepID=UPI0035AEF473
MPRPPPDFFLLLLLCTGVWSYEVPREKEDLFATKPCPAFLTFVNAAYLAGATVELPCHCKPMKFQSVVWFYKKHLGSFAETKALTDFHGNRLLDLSRVPHASSLQSRFSIRMFSLLIYRAAPEDSGIYICGSAYSDFFYAYDLDIQEARRIKPTLMNATHPQQNKTTVTTAPPKYQVFTSYRPWSGCDRCGVPGEQMRVGICYVRSNNLHKHYRRENQTVASCRSGGVPVSFGLAKQKHVGATLEVKSCQVECPDDPKSSKMSRLLSFLGYNSNSQSAEVPVFYLNHPADHVLTMGCPGARPGIAVAWDRGSTPLYRSELSAESKPKAAPPRLVVDSGNHLIFNPAETQDSGVYYCWLRGRQAAKIHLLVYAHLGRRQSVMSHPDFWPAVNTVLISYVVMFVVFCILLICRAAFRHLSDDEETHVD